MINKVKNNKKAKPEICFWLICLIYCNELIGEIQDGGNTFSHCVQALLLFTLCIHDQEVFLNFTKRCSRIIQNGHG